MKWVSVKDRLPDCEQQILFYDQYGNVNVGCLVQDVNGLTEWFANGEYLGFCDVTHWMPLPEPPKQI